MRKRFDLVTLELFVAVATSKSIAQAAATQNIAASAISKRITDLEAQVETALFYRQKTGDGIKRKYGYTCSLGSPSESQSLARLLCRWGRAHLDRKMVHLVSVRDFVNGLC